MKFECGACHQKKEHHQLAKFHFPICQACRQLVKQWRYQALPLWFGQ